MKFIHDIVLETSQSHPNKIAAIDNDLSITYAELEILIASFQQRLIQEGINKGDRVAALCAPSIDFLIEYLAITSYGAIFVGLNPKYTSHELAYILKDSQPKLIISKEEIRGRSYLQEFENFSETINTLLYKNFSETLLDSNLTLNTNINYDDPCAIIYTSGTTGQPKGALISHGGLTQCCQAQHNVVGIEHPVILNNLPINHIGCIGDTTAYALLAEGTIVFQQRFNAEGVLDLIEKHKISWWGQVPTMFQLALDKQDITPRDLSSVQSIYTSGAVASLALISRLRKITNNIQNAYGMTETIGSICWVIDGDNETLSTTIGKPIAPYNVQIGDADGNPITPGQKGEVQVKGHMHMLGYWNNPHETKKAYTTNGWFCTGDLAIEEADGNFTLVGRSKEIFISGGYNIYPAEIEKALVGLINIKIAVVVPVTDTLYNEVGYAYVVTNNGKTYNANDAKFELSKLLANYKIPKYFESITELPMLANGKINREKLKHQAQNKK